MQNRSEVGEITVSYSHGGEVVSEAIVVDIRVLLGDVPWKRLALLHKVCGVDVVPEAIRVVPSEVLVSVISEHPGVIERLVLDECPVALNVVPV
jgi:hypothetical protein